jgi:DNA-binding response OmpR family regulator
MADDRKTVLVVEDEPDALEYLTTVLEDHGYAAVPARDGDQAMKYLDQIVPDLVTLDISIPEKSGVAVYRRLRDEEHLRSVPVVIVTGISQDFERFISTRRHVPPPDGYVNKPVDHEQLLEVVDRLLA